MYEICFDENYDHILATAWTPQEAMAALDRIADETAAQLRVNGEGHQEFLLSLVASNDIGGAGTIAAVPIATIAERWHATYLGWSPPAFDHGI